MLDKKLKAKWVRALRSGKYKQGTGTLRINAATRKDEKFCCLGVLCEITGKRRTLAGYMIGKSYATDILPTGSLLFTQLGGHDVQDKLANMNDGTDETRRRGFKQIATWIERNL